MQVRYNEPRESDRIQGCHDSEGFIDENLLNDIVGEQSASYYFCGPKPMLRAIYQLLKKKNIAEADMRYEFFGPAEALSG